MAPDHASDHEHDLDPEYLYPSDAQVLEIRKSDAGLTIDVVLPCPECDHSLQLTTTVTDVAESGIDLPLEEDFYD